MSAPRAHWRRLPPGGRHLLMGHRRFKDGWRTSDASRSARCSTTGSDPARDALIPTAATIRTAPRCALLRPHARSGGPRRRRPGTSDGILRLRFESHRLAHRCCLRSEIGKRKARVADYLPRDASAERPRRADEPVGERCRATGLPAAKDRGVRCIPLGPEPPITGSSMPSGDRDRRRRAGRPASSPPENHERVRCARIAAPSAPRFVDRCHRSSSGVRSEE